MVEKSSENYQVQFVKHVITDQNFAEYTAKIIAPGGFAFQFKDRYSSMRDF